MQRKRNGISIPFQPRDIPVCTACGKPVRCRPVHRLVRTDSHRAVSTSAARCRPIHRKRSVRPHQTAVIQAYTSHLYPSVRDTSPKKAGTDILRPVCSRNTTCGKRPTHLQKTFAYEEKLCYLWAFLYLRYGTHTVNWVITTYLKHQDL